MGALEISWEVQVGEVRVFETEHLFGFDVILDREVDGRRYPQAIISRQRRMNGLERAWAARWCAAAAGDEWGTAVAMMQRLCEAPMK